MMAKKVTACVPSFKIFLAVFVICTLIRAFVICLLVSIKRRCFLSSKAPTL